MRRVKPWEGYELDFLEMESTPKIKQCPNLSFPPRHVGVHSSGNPQIGQVVATLVNEERTAGSYVLMLRKTPILLPRSHKVTKKNNLFY
jgi:hypothetical protein